MSNDHAEPPIVGRTSSGARRQPAIHGYSATARFLHWLVVLLLATQFVIAILMPDIGPKTLAGPLIDLHFSFGVLILIVMAVRWILRLLDPVPLDMPDSPRWERGAARAMHRAFYVILLVGPFLGWASASAHRLAVSLFGIIPLPAIAAPRARWALTAGDVHIVMMWTLAVLIALHAGVALYHGFVRHDGVLQRMLPVNRS